MKKTAKTVLLLLLLLLLVGSCASCGDSAQQTQAETLSPPPTEETHSAEEAHAAQQTHSAQQTHAPTGQPQTDAGSEKQAAQAAGDFAPSPEKPAKKPADPPAKPVSSLSCTLEIRCATLLAQGDALDEAKRALVPADGILFAEKTLSFTAGETVFDVLLRELKAEKMHLEYVDTPLYHSAYVEGIANLYEFDCGALSGWVYCVNGVFPNYGSGGYALQDGDKILWQYTCDLGVDVGGNNGEKP